MTEFDRYSHVYERMRAWSVRRCGCAPGFFHEYKVALVFQTIAREGLADGPLSILNFGCGIGGSDPFFVKYFPKARVHAIDVSVESLRLARQTNRGLERIVYRAVEEEKPLPFSDLFGVIFVASVLHHIPARRHDAVLRDLLQHLAPGGTLFVFEHNPHNPLTLRAVRECPMDATATLLRPKYATSMIRAAGFSSVRTRFTLFFPGFLSALRPLENFLGWLPLGAQYYVRARR